MALVQSVGSGEKDSIDRGQANGVPRDSVPTILNAQHYSALFEPTLVKPFDSRGL
jgi:hypothetical protein